MFTFEPDEELLNTQIVNICVIIITIALLVNNLNIKDTVKGKSLLFLKENKALISCAFAIMLLSLWFGDRGPAIQMFFIITFVFVTFVTKIKLRVFVPLVIFGLFLMTIISYTRGSDNNLKSGSIGNTFNEASQEVGQFNSFWNYGMDLIVNNRNLFVALEIGNRREPLYGKSYFPYLFSPIPGISDFINGDRFRQETRSFCNKYRYYEIYGLRLGSRF